MLVLTASIRALVSSAGESSWDGTFVLVSLSVVALVGVGSVIMDDGRESGCDVAASFTGLPGPPCVLSYSVHRPAHTHIQTCDHVFMGVLYSVRGG